MRLRRTLVLLTIFAALAAAGAAAATRDDTAVRARARAREDRLRIHHARTTLRFFERHAFILYRGPLRIRRIGWREVRRARVVLARARRDLRVAMDALPYVAPWPWSCIFHYESAGLGWTVSTGNGYYGGLQMDLDFEATYGREYLDTIGNANLWPPRVQVRVAERARDGYLGIPARGYAPWPTTARACGVL